MRSTKTHCDREVERLSKLPAPFGVDRKGLIEELKLILLGRSQSNDHLTRIVQRAVETCITCPTPAELIGLLGEVDADATALAEPCSRCAPDGGYWVQQMAIKNIGFGQQQYDYSGRCNCARGKELARRDKNPKMGGMKPGDYVRV